MTIILLLFHWFCRYSWLSSKLLLFHLNLLINSSFTGNEHLLKLSGFCLCFSDSLDMISLSINCRIFTLFFFKFCLFLCSNLSKLGLFFSGGHLSPRLITWEGSLSGGCYCSSLVNSLWVNLNYCLSFLGFRLRSLLLLINTFCFLFGHLSLHFSLSFGLCFCIQINCGSCTSLGGCSFLWLLLSLICLGLCLSLGLSLGLSYSLWVNTSSLCLSDSSSLICGYFSSGCWGCRYLFSLSSSLSCLPSLLGCDLGFSLSLNFSHLFGWELWGIWCLCIPNLSGGSCWRSFFIIDAHERIELY